MRSGKHGGEHPQRDGDGERPSYPHAAGGRAAVLHRLVVIYASR